VHRVPLFLVALFVASACTSEPGGGGVNIGAETTTASSTVPPTTTTTMPPTTTTLPLVLVSGHVADTEGDPVSGATVVMGEAKHTTGSDGSFLFETTKPEDMTVLKPGWTTTALEFAATETYYQTTIEPVKVRGLRVGAEAARDDAAFAALLQMARDTAVNTLVFDTKQEGGKVLYDTGVEEAHEIGAVEVFYDPTARIAEAHAEGLYVITRIVTFEDAQRVAAIPEEKLAGIFLDPRSESARAYVLALAEEACELGFDEIQFDYVRFPSGATAQVTGQLDMTQDERVGIITSFLGEARSLLAPMGCAVSADIFGIVASTADDQGLGQRPEELSAVTDALSPMVYPSHYSNGWLGFDDPNDHPYDVTADAISDALPRMAEGSTLRPYLQAFWWTNEQIRRSIQAAEDLDVGWILWNARSNFDPAALPTDEEVSS
jgi:hypothetical protein